MKHRDAPSTCIGCHAEDDAHKKALGDDCASCHSVESWKQTRFDHAKASDPSYPLTGAHEKVECGLCHAGQRYKDTPTTCVACHRIDDAHQGQRGTDCESCHTTAEWKEQTFDHFRKTGFALTAGHSGLACVACHAGNDFKKTDGKTCVDCHRSDDTHQGRNGVECKTCHTTKAWKDGKFDHAKETKFALNGAHAELGCVACHKGAAKTEKLETDLRVLPSGERPAQGIARHRLRHLPWREDLAGRRALRSRPHGLPARGTARHHVLRVLPRGQEVRRHEVGVHRLPSAG